LGLRSGLCILRIERERAGNCQNHKGIDRVHGRQRGNLWPECYEAWLDADESNQPVGKDAV
jgi:hypothetical protein